MQVGFWKLVFIFFPVKAVTLGTDIAILGVQNLSIGRLGASFDHLGDHFVSVGTSWGTVGAPGRTRGPLNQMTESTP